MLLWNFCSWFLRNNYGEYTKRWCVSVYVGCWIFRYECCWTSISENSVRLYYNFIIWVVKIRACGQHLLVRVTVKSAWKVRELRSWTKMRGWHHCPKMLLISHVCDGDEILCVEKYSWGMNNNFRFLQDVPITNLRRYNACFNSGMRARPYWTCRILNSSVEFSGMS